VKVVQVNCPQCEQPIYQKRTDEMFLCQNCGALHHRDMAGPHLVPYEIADPNPQATGQRYYLPFWRLLCQVNIKSRDEVGGWTQRLSKSIKGGDNGGTLYVFMPASELDTATFRRLSVTLTMSPPHYVARKDFLGIERVSTTMSQSEAVEMADFVVVTLEAEKPGTLQHLDYELKVQESKLIYLPFVNSASGPTMVL
jgi:hypothetical protein